ncbi:MAG: Type 1 glutamine amidotransferase-like domain-containing protein [Bacilli bacterium]|nr:Type 1 glutamine amidotransferase-like domain-containing protein [Bacilli bacterium]
MKLILSSSDFLNEYSKQVIINNIDKELLDNKVLFIPNEKATKEKINSNKYYDRLYRDGFTNRDNIYIFDETEVDRFRNLNIDLIYISGGNTFATLDKIKKCDFDKDIIDYIKNGVIYIGGSCGAHIVSKNIKHLEELDNNYLNIKEYDALGLFNGIIIPHYNEEKYNPELRKQVYNNLVNENKYKVYALTNDDSLVIIDDTIIKYKGVDPNE